MSTTNKPQKRKNQYKIKHLYIGFASMLLIGAGLFTSFYYFNVSFGLFEIVAYIVGVTVILTLIYNSYNLEFQINSRRKSNDLAKAKFSYEIISKWSSSEMFECVNSMRAILRDDSLKDILHDPAKVSEFKELLNSRPEDKGRLVQVLNYFENISIMLNTEFVDRSIVEHNFKSLFIDCYQDLRNFIDDRQRKHPRSWCTFEMLCKGWLEEEKKA